MGMLPFLIAGLAAGSVFLVAVGIAMSGGSGGVASRLERYARSQGIDTTASRRSASSESAVIAGLSRVIEGQDLSTRLSTEIARADLKLRPAEFLFAWIASPFVFAFVGYVLGFILPGFQNPVALAVLFAIGAYFPRWYVGLPAAQAADRLRPPAAGHDHPPRQLAAGRLVVPAGARAGHAGGAAADLRGVRARRARDEPRRGAPAGAQQPGPPRGVGGPRADGHRHQHPEPGRWQPRDGARLDRLHHSRAGPDPG